MVKDQEALESVQRFALRLCCKNWSAAYLQLLDSTDLTTLSAKRKIAKLCFLYKIVNNLTSFPANIIRFRSSVPFHIQVLLQALFQASVQALDEEVWQKK